MGERITTDVAIVGGGIAACAAAVALRRAGLSVVLMEKRRCGAGASGVNFGGVRRQGRDLREMPLANRARLLWDGLSALLGEDVEFESSGHIKLARSEADLAELERYSHAARAVGLDLTMLGTNAVRAELPWLGERVVGASLSPDCGQANPRVVGPAFARLARRMGADIREFTPATGAWRAGDGFVVTAEGLEVSAKYLVNAAGAGSRLLAAAFGEDVPVTPLMPNMIVTEPMRYFINRSIGVCGGDVYVRQIQRGNVIFGGGMGWLDHELGLGRPVSDNTLDGINRTLQVIPGIAQAQVIRTWSGVDSQMPDHIPVLGPSATTPGLIHAFGFSGHGFQIAPAVGEVIADLIVDGQTPTAIADFTITRFRNWTPGTTEETTHTEH